MHLKRLGPYEIDKPLGKGGMGSVYAAVDTTTGQRVAIKALTPHLAMADGFRERFEAEIESLKTLRHEGIVRLFGYGEQEGVLFYSMELVEGSSLEDELKAGRRFNWREVSSIAIQLALALKHAHDHGIVHRDIKPANVLMYGEDRVKLADFGIARLFGTTQLTTAGGVLGTADYMSPEQADGRPVTARCDQYSLGGVMYTLLAGRPPFQAKSLPQMLQLQRFAKPEPVRRYAPDTPEQLERVIMQLLAKNPAERFPNTQVLARHLQAMEKALSRPAADDFALAIESHSADSHEAEFDHALATDATQLETPLSRPDEPPAKITSGSGSAAPGENGSAGMLGSESHDAPTLAADEMAAQRSSGHVPASAVSTGAAAKPVRLDGRPSHFITVEDEEARRRAERQRSWLVVAAQLVLLAAVLFGMGAMAVYLSRPRSADDLYQTIVSRGIAGDDASVADVEEEIAEFLNRFPTDSRARELAKHQERIALDRAERKLQRDARGDGSANAQLLPVERLYTQAMNIAETSPDAAIATLRSLVDLYGVDQPASANDVAAQPGQRVGAIANTDARVSLTVRLAERLLADLTTELAQQRKAQIAALEERLETARRLTSSDPSRAAAMYRAIIHLHRDHTWAEDAVAEAREQLDDLERSR
jgi:serine/threonine-protein kinase